MTVGFEINIDMLPGPTHSFAGLSEDNLASISHKTKVSHPKKSALQVLEKCKFLHDLGLKQMILPPQLRPSIPSLKNLGFSGSDAHILNEVYKQDPYLLYSLSSSSFMWAANHVTVTPSIDAGDSHTHFTPANLISHFHRSIEHTFTSKIYQFIFNNPLYFTHHNKLPSVSLFSDEGAANHMRLSEEYSAPGIHIFSYGKEKRHPSSSKVFQARQSKEAQETIARRHQLFSDRTFFARQRGDAIDAGVFHNDVVAASNQHFLFLHEKAWVDQTALLEKIKISFEKLCDIPLYVQVVREKDVLLAECVKTYLFNSQIITLPNNTMSLIAPKECLNSPLVKNILDEMIHDQQHPINSIHYLDVQESMNNGGGPACLRQRVVLNENELKFINHGFFLNDDLYDELKNLIETYYRNEIHIEDLQDVSLLNEARFLQEKYLNLFKMPLDDFNEST